MVKQRTPAARHFLQIFFFAAALLCGITVATAAGIKFPALTGRVVDDAHMLSAGTIQTLTEELRVHEEQTTNQVVIVTLPSLQGQTIEDFGVQLGRHWGIGQKWKDNGVILLVAPKERKVRIEVGYGLEATLTDAASSQIVHDIILPDFRAGKMEEGVVHGANAILNVLGEPDMNGFLPLGSLGNNSSPALPLWGLVLIVLLGYLLPIIIFLISIRAMFFLYSPGASPSSHRISSSSYRVFGVGGGFGGGGFSGGGGGFGGGGCSGGW